MSITIPAKSAMLTAAQRKRKPKADNSVKFTLDPVQSSLVEYRMFELAERGLERGRLAPMINYVDYMVMRYAGARVSTAHLIRLEDLNLHGNNDPSEDTITLHGKGGKAVAVPVDPRLSKVIEGYLTLRPALKCPETGQEWLLPSTMLRTGRDGTVISRPGEARSDDVILKYLNKVGKDCGLPQTLTNHCLRRTCATAWMRAGVRVNVISKLLMHSSVQVTLRYIDTNADDMVDGINTAFANRV